MRPGAPLKIYIMYMGVRLTSTLPRGAYRDSSDRTATRPAIFLPQPAQPPGERTTRNVHVRLWNQPTAEVREKSQPQIPRRPFTALSDESRMKAAPVGTREWFAGLEMLVTRRFGRSNIRDRRTNLDETCAAA